MMKSLENAARERQLFFCGTGSWEAIPGAFCNCRICTAARRDGGPDVRTRTCYRLGDDLQIDFGPDVIAQRNAYKFDYARLRDLFVSHPHDDHFSPMHLAMRQINTRNPPLHLYGAKEVLDLCRAYPGFDAKQLGIVMHELHAGDTVTAAASPVRATAVPANHNRGVGAFNYVFELENGFTLLLGTDTGFPLPEAWTCLERFRFDLVVLDCTAGLLDVPKTNGHMSAAQVLEVVGILREKRLLAPGCRIFTNHISCLSKMNHRESCEFFAPHGIEPACDGLAVPCRKGAAVR